MEHFFWITSRAAGIAALLASSAAVALGLMMAMRLRKGQDLRVMHEALSLATMVALAVHALALLGDGYLKPSLADVTIPFVSGYERWWMALGIVGGWTFVILGVSYYWRGRIGPQRWRRLHRFTALAWVLGVAHSIAMGTDAGALWFLVAAASLVLPAGALLARRLPPSGNPSERVAR
jgi:methionine sulfoxide reductase heme-binding subunit